MSANLPTIIEPPKLTTLDLSPELWRLLAEGPSQNIEEIGRAPAMKDEARRCSRQLEILTEPAGDKVVMSALAPLVLVYGKGQEATAPAFWKVYTEALSDLPRIALDRAAAEYTRVGKFFPKPAEIRELAERHAMALRQAAYRAVKAAAWTDPEASAIPASERMPREKFEALMADTLAKLKAKEPPPPTLKRTRPTPSAPVDDRGISDAARALIAKQAAA